MLNTGPDIHKESFCLLIVYVPSANSLLHRSQRNHSSCHCYYAVGINISFWVITNEEVVKKMLDVSYHCPCQNLVNNPIILLFKLDQVGRRVFKQTPSYWALESNTVLIWLDFQGWYTSEHSPPSFRGGTGSAWFLCNTFCMKIKKCLSALVSS